MSFRVGDKTDSVQRCVPRQDGGFMIVARKGATGSSADEMREGERVIIANGIARRPGQ